MDNSVVDDLYRLRRNFAIVGLTGRTGSGCTTISKILENESFDDINAPMPSVKQEGISNDERKYKIVYNFTKENWQKFFTIRASDIIFYFVLRAGFKAFIESLQEIESKEKEKKDKNAFNEIERKFRNLETDFNSKNQTVNEIETFLANRESYLLRYEKDENKTKEIYDKSLEYKKFLFDELRDFRKVVTELYEKSMISVFQEWGNNIRKYGDIYENKENNERVKPATLARKINAIIKLLEDMNIYDKKPTFIVIDAIRNPYEVMYFRERFAAFYLLAVSANEITRNQNLFTKKFNAEEVKAIDDKECPDSSKGIEIAYFEQDIQKCIELADIFIHNDGTPIEQNNTLKKQILQYVSLMMHPGLVPPTPIERMMQIAHVTKLNSGCLSRQVGACITDEFFSLKAIGWNTVPEGQTPCSLCDFSDLVKRCDENAYSEYELNNKEFRYHLEKLDSKYRECFNKGHSLLRGIPFGFCFKDIYMWLKNDKNQVHTRSLHAEENAFLQLAKYGSQGIKGGKLFTTASPCELCSKKAYQLGIKEIYYIDIYPGISFSHIISNGIREKRPQFIYFQGAIGRAYDSLYNPIIMLKDEIAYITGVKVRNINNGKSKSKTIKDAEKEGKNGTDSKDE